MTDTKSGGQKGMLTITNLRFLWIEARRAQSVSIGFNTIARVSVRSVRDSVGVM